MVAYRLSGGGIVFTQKHGMDVVSTLDLACGQCIGCRLERSRQWAVRCVHESQLHEESCFVTLTYSDECLPVGGSLVHRHVQLFLKRLRRSGVKLRYVVAGEYSPELWRPHYHGLLFGYWPRDAVFYRESEAGAPVYVSKSLTELWSLGECFFSHVTFEAAAYVARYCVKKVTGDAAELHYRRVDVRTGEEFQLQPEYLRCSLKPGIGAGWLEKFGKEVYPLDRVVVRGREMRPPRYYDRIVKELEGSLPDEVEHDRATVDYDPKDFGSERLAVRERVALSKSELFKRR